MAADNYCSTDYAYNVHDETSGHVFSYQITDDVEISVAESEEIGNISLTVANYTGASSTQTIPASTTIYLEATNIWGYDMKGDGTSSQTSERLTPTGKVALSYDVNGVERYAMTDDSWIYASDYPNGLSIRPKTMVDSCVVTFSNIKISEDYKGYAPTFEAPRENVELKVVGTSDNEGNKFVFFYYYFSGTQVRTTSVPVAVTEYPVSFQVGTSTYKIGDMIPISGEIMEVKFVYASESSGTTNTGSSSANSAAVVAAMSGASSTANNNPVSAASATPNMSSNSSIDSAKVKTSANGTAKIFNIKSEAKEVEIDDTIEVDGVSYKVKTLGEGALKNCKNATEVTLPSSLTKIEKGAFTGAKKVKTIKFDVKNPLPFKRVHLRESIQKK